MKKLFTFAVAMFCALYVLAADPTSGSCGANLTWILLGSELQISGSGAMDNYTSNTAPWNSIKNSIAQITLPPGITSIGNNAFRTLQSIVRINIPANVTTIGDNAFYGCSQLKTVKFAENSSLTTIGELAFSNCSALQDVNIPASLTKVKKSAFNNCYALIHVYYGGTLAQWCTIDFAEENSNPIQLSKLLMINDQFIMTLDIPEGVTSIKKYAFYKGENFVSLTIPSTVTTIGDKAFNYCTGLQKIVVNCTTPPDIQFSTFEFVPTDVELLVPSGSDEAYRSHEFWGCFTKIKANPTGPLAPGMYMTITTKDAQVFNFNTKNIESVEYNRITE